MNAKQFIQSIEQNTSLESELNLAGWTSEAAVTLGAAHGFTFTARELQTAMDEAWGSLSEEELRNAAGGKDDKTKKDDDGGANASTCSLFYGH